MDEAVELKAKRRSKRSRKFRVNGIHITHFEVPDSNLPDEKMTARLALLILGMLAEKFCLYQCDRTYCTIGRQNNLAFFDLSEEARIKEEKAREREWVKWQKSFHEVLSSFPRFKLVVGGCPACAVTRAFAYFRILVCLSKIRPVASVETDGEGNSFKAKGGQRKSLPCFIAITDGGESGNDRELVAREKALLHVDLDELPAFGREFDPRMREALMYGQAVLRELDRASGRSRKLDKHVVSLIEQEDGWHWFDNGKDMGRIARSDGSMRYKILRVLFDQIGHGWTPHATFYRATGWEVERYFPRGDNPGLMQRQLSILRKLLSIDIHFNKKKGVRFPGNVVKSK